MKSIRSLLALLVMVNIPNLVLAECKTGEMESHPDLCDRYLVCANGVFIEMFCPSGLVFNPELNVCDWPSNVDCTISSETTPSWTSTPSTTVTIPSTTVTTPSTTVTIPSTTVTIPSTTVTIPSTTVTIPSTTVTIPSTTVTMTSIIPTALPSTTVTSSTTVRPSTTQSTTVPPPPETDTVPLYRLFQPSTGNHFYTTSRHEADNAVSSLSYNLEGIAGLVSSAPSPSVCPLIPVYRLVIAASIHDHFFTTNEYEAEIAQSTHGYTLEGIAYYCAASANMCGSSSAFYRYNLHGNHFYTTNVDEGNSVVAAGGIFEGIMCYIWN